MASKAPVVLLLLLALHGGVHGSAQDPDPGLPTDLPEHQSTKANFKKAVKFFLITSDSPAGVLVDLEEDAFLASGFNKSQPTTVIIHGYGHSIKGRVFKAVAGALLQTGARTNVVGVDWGELCPKPHYLRARGRVAGVGARVSDLVAFLVDRELGTLADVHIVGHSLGAHVAGNAGKITKVGRITGLDPAQPLFFNSSADRLSSDDADLVDVVHTCVGILGYRLPLGHVDFYPNGGRVSQPGCGFLGDGIKLGSCSHARAFELFAESIVNDKAFPATPCPSYVDALRGSCAEDDTGTTVFMGMNQQDTEPGVYFLRTRGSSPFSPN